MIPEKIDEITDADIQALVDNEASEGRTLDFKQELPGKSDSDKKEYLADVSSFANAGGGDLVFGIREDAGVAAEVMGVACADNDAEILRMESSILSGIEPRIPGVRFHPVNGFSKGPVFVLRIPKSWSSPHMVTFKGGSRFFTRNNAGKHQMDVGEIRSAFLLSESLPEKIRQFRLDRLGKIAANEGPVALADKPKIVLHIVPFSAFSLDSSLDAKAIYDKRLNLNLLYGGSDSIRYNVDGVVNIGIRQQEVEHGTSGYCQVFRSGNVESVDTVIISDGDERKLIASLLFEQAVVSSVQEFMNVFASLNVSPPFVVAVALLGVRGFQMASPQNRMKFSNTPIDRDDLILPEILIMEHGSDAGLAMRPIMDAAWNASGWEGSPNYDENGDWKVAYR